MLNNALLASNDNDPYQSDPIRESQEYVDFLRIEKTRNLMMFKKNVNRELDNQKPTQYSLNPKMSQEKVNSNA